MQQAMSLSGVPVVDQSAQSSSLPPSQPQSFMGGLKGLSSQIPPQYQQMLAALMGGQGGQGMNPQTLAIIRSLMGQ
jgi:hypothetical protein